MTALYTDIYSTPDRILLILWCLLCLLTSLVGNTTVLFTSNFVVPVTEIDKFTTIFLRNLAVSDIAYTLTRILPSLISHISQGWVLGDRLCAAEGYVYLIPVMASMALIICLTCMKVFAVLAPLRAHRISSRTIRVIVVIIWVQAALPNIVAMFAGVKVEVNGEIETICEEILNNTSPLEYSIGIAHNVQIWIPSLLILPCNTALWCLAHKHAKTHNISCRKAITTVLSISMLFVVTWIPTIIEEAWRLWGEEQDIPLWFNKAHINFYFISAFGNPVLYALINKRYRTAAIRHIHMPGQSQERSLEMELHRFGRRAKQKIKERLSISAQTV